jgi:hypothetical protein
MKDKSSFRFDYVSGIREVLMQPGLATISLVGEVPHLLENGIPKTDLRDILLGDSVPVVLRGQRGKQRSKSGGFYRAIPFRHLTPGAGASRVGTPMGGAYSGEMALADAKKLGNRVYRAAKKLEATRSKPGKTVYGGRLKTKLPGKKGPGISVPKLKPHHKTDIFSGMIREEKTYESATQSQYITFRTISTEVEEGWIRKPIEARHYVKKVSDFVTGLAPMAFKAFMESRS